MCFVCFILRWHQIARAESSNFLVGEVTESCPKSKSFRNGSISLAHWQKCSRSGSLSQKFDNSLIKGCASLREVPEFLFELLDSAPESFGISIFLCAKTLSRLQGYVQFFQMSTWKDLRKSWSIPKKSAWGRRMLTERTVDRWRVPCSMPAVFSCVVETLIQFRKHFCIFFLMQPEEILWFLMLYFLSV